MNTKYSKLIARILSVICFILLIVPVGLSITSMKEVLNECSGNTSETPSSSNQEATLEWIEWRTTEPWYLNIKHTSSKTTTSDDDKSSSLTPLGATSLSIDLIDKTMKALEQIEAKEASEEQEIVTTVTEVPITEPVSQENVEQETEINNEPTYIEEPVVQEPEVPQESIPPVVEEPPVPPEPESPPAPSGDESWYYETLLTHDGYETSWSYENQQILKRYCDQYGVDYELMLAVISKESGYNQWAESYCGAIGLCQVMPITIKQFNMDTGIYYDSYYSVESNIHVGVHTMAACINKFGNLYDACTAYNQGLYSSGVGYYSSYAENTIALREKILALKS